LSEGKKVNEGGGREADEIRVETLKWAVAKLTELCARPGFYGSCEIDFKDGLAAYVRPKPVYKVEKSS
jgi:hypothetical protein